MPEPAPHLSIVVIGYNEAAHLPACFEALRALRLDAIRHETLYVDGGSTDDSRAIAAANGARVFGDDGRRRAAENRNIGLHHAAGEFIQFVDGDMALHPDWPQAAMALLRREPGAAVVFGQLRERNDSAFYRALQIDWQYPEGDALYCGGAAMFRRTPLLEIGGFPEDVAYGEEPLLCWRLRNDAGWTVQHLHHPMALHDLAYRGFADYWRRTVRVGETYAEIADRCRNSAEPFWSAEVRANLRWGFLLLFMLLLPPLWPVLALVVLRKFWQTLRQGQPLSVAAIYAAHTYFAKLAIATGILRGRRRHGLRWHAPAT